MIPEVDSRLPNKVVELVFSRILDFKISIFKSLFPSPDSPAARSISDKAIRSYPYVTFTYFFCINV